MRDVASKCAGGAGFLGCADMETLLTAWLACRRRRDGLEHFEAEMECKVIYAFDGENNSILALTHGVQVTHIHLHL